MAEAKKNIAQGDAPDADDVQALKAQVDALTKENTRLNDVNQMLGKDRDAAQKQIGILTQENASLDDKHAEYAIEIDSAHEIIDELKAKIAGYEAAPQTDGSGRKIHTLKGTKRKFQLAFPTRLNGELVNDDAIVADNGKLAELVTLESGAIREVGE